MIKIDGVQIKEPTTLNVSRFNLTNSGRVLSGKMTMDLIAKKKKLEITYDVISGSDFQQILDLIDTDKMFFTVEFEDHSGTQSIVCYVGAIPNDYFRKQMGWYYRNVNFSLIEQ